MKVSLQNLVKSNLFKSSIILTISNLVISFLNYLFNIIAGRALGPAGYGEVTALFSYLYIFSVPLSIITTIMIQKIGSTSHDKIAYTHAIEIWASEKIKRWWYLGIILALIIPFIPRITNLHPFVAYSMIPLIVLSLLSAVYDGAFQGLQLFLWFSVLSFVVVALKVTGALLALTGIKGLEIIVLFLLISAVGKIIISKKVFHSLVKKKSSENAVMIQKRLIANVKDNAIWITTLSILSITLLNNADVIFVKKFFTAQEAGLYSSWSLFAKIILYAVGPILSLGFIFFSDKEHQQKHVKTFFLSLIVLFFIGLISYFFYTFFGELIILSFFGSQYKDIIPLLGSASIFGILYVVILYTNNFFIAQKSKLALILPSSIPIYLLGLFLVNKNLHTIINLNIIFVASITFLCLVAYGKTFFYNNGDGNKKSKPLPQFNNPSL